MSKVTLSYGCNQGIPDGVECAWGVRAIIQGGYLDYVPDRMGTDVRDDIEDNVGVMMREEILHHLNTVVGNIPKQNAEALIRAYQWKPSDHDVRVLFEDDKCKVVGSPQGSHGYLYLAAWMKEHVTLQNAEVCAGTGNHEGQDTEDCDECEPEKYYPGEHLSKDDPDYQRDREFDRMADEELDKR